MINLDIEKAINQQIETAVRDYLDSDELKQKIKDQVNSAAGIIVERLAGKVYAEVVKESNLAEHIKSIVSVEAANQLKNLAVNLIQNELAVTPVKDIVTNIVKQEAQIRLNNFAFPENSIDSSSIKWRPGCLNGSYVSHGKIASFSSTGIEDQATDCKLTILDDITVVGNEFSAPVITVTEQLNTNNLSILGTLEVGQDVVDNGGLTKLMQTYFRETISHELQHFSPLMIEGQTVISVAGIHPAVASSNLRKVGNLLDLTVSGDAKFSETLFVGSNGRIGINTDEPRGALTVCDEDAELSISRTKRKTMFIGSTKDSQIEIGTNNRAQILVKDDLVDFATAIRVLGITFSVQDTVPDQIGNPNDIVFVRNARDQQPKFYICNGGNRWSALG